MLQRKRTVSTLKCTFLFMLSVTVHVVLKSLDNYVFSHVKYSAAHEFKFDGEVLPASLGVLKPSTS